MSEERPFEVVDRRRVREDADEAPQGPDAGGESGADDLPPFNPFAGITALGVLQMTCGLLSERAWIAMGMVAEPGSGKLEADFGDAQLAIDALGDLVPRLEAHLEPAQRRELQTELTNLRLNFVRQKSGGSG